MTATGTVRVLVADDDRASREGVRLALVEHGFEVCAESASAADAIGAAGRERPDVCLVDAELPGGGIAAAHDIVRTVPHAVVVMLGVRAADDDQLFAALDAGAHGYLPKSMDPGRLPTALRAALDGEAALPRALVGLVIDELRARKGGRHATELAQLGVTLTRREREVFELLSRDLDTAQIADSLAISAVTVRRHVSAILRKLGAPDRQSALRALRGYAAKRS